MSLILWQIITITLLIILRLTYGMLNCSDVSGNCAVLPWTNLCKSRNIFFFKVC